MSVCRMLVVFGLVPVALGLLWPAIDELGLGPLPGDIVIEGDSFRLYLQLATKHQSLTGHFGMSCEAHDPIRLMPAIGNRV